MIFINVSIKKLNMNYRKICTFITRDMEHGIFACYQKCLGFQKEHTGLPATVHTIHDNGREAKWTCFS